jgi:hypothetical protein
VRDAGGFYSELQNGSSFQVAHSYWGNAVYLFFNMAQTVDGTVNHNTVGSTKYTVPPGSSNTRAMGMLFDANAGSFHIFQLPVSPGVGVDALLSQRVYAFTIESSGMVSGGVGGTNGLRSNGHFRVYNSSGGRCNIYAEGNSAGSIQFVTASNGAWCEMWQGATMISDDYSIARNYWLQLRYDSAAKPGTNVWTVASDAATKRNIKPFERASAYLRSLPKPVEFEYNGEHDTPAGMRGVGYVAQELEAVAPEMVEVHKVPRWVDDPRSPGVQKQDGEDDMRFTNTGDLIHIHTNVLLEILDRLDRIEARLQGGAPGTPPDRS